MGARWVQGDVKLAAGRFRIANQVIDAAAQANLETEGQSLEEYGKDLIANHLGTGKEWSREWNGKTSSSPGRVTSGSMRNDFSHVVNKTRGAITLAVGWVRNFQDYYGFQDKGFNHWLGMWVEGMQLNMHMKSLVKQATDRAGKEIIRGLVRHLRGGR